MSAMINPNAMLFIEQKLRPIIKSGKKVENLRLMVCPMSPIAIVKEVETIYGPLQVVPGEYLKKGFSYLIESPLSRGGIGFSWVSRSIK